MIVKNLDRFIFTGDTLFIGGCGRFFEGKVVCLKLCKSLSLGLGY